MNTDLSEMLPTFTKKKGKPLPLLTQFHVDSNFVVGVYQGTLSDFDIIVKYRQFINGRWTNPRTPKHIHWAVDLLIKQNENPSATLKFIDFLIEYWETVQPIKTAKERDELFDTLKLQNEVNKEASNYDELAEKGEYSVKFLLLLAKLLMHQEKTNYPGAYMFRRLLEQLKTSPDIFSVVSTATFR